MVPQCQLSTFQYNCTVHFAPLSNPTGWNYKDSLFFYWLMSRRLRSTTTIVSFGIALSPFVTGIDLRPLRFGGFFVLFVDKIICQSKYSAMPAYCSLSHGRHPNREVLQKCTHCYDDVATFICGTKKTLINIQIYQIRLCLFGCQSTTAWNHEFCRKYLFVHKSRLNLLDNVSLY